MQTQITPHNVRTLDAIKRTTKLNKLRDLFYPLGLIENIGYVPRYDWYDEYDYGVDILHKYWPKITI